jgi:hypothetical protein
MDFFFTQSELYWLDHLLPEAVRRMKEDESRKDDNGVTYGDEEMVKIKVYHQTDPCIFCSSNHCTHQGYEPNSPSSKALLQDENFINMEDDPHMK